MSESNKNKNTFSKMWTELVDDKKGDYYKWLMPEPITVNVATSSVWGSIEDSTQPMSNLGLCECPVCKMHLPLPSTPDMALAKIMPDLNAVVSCPVAVPGFLEDGSIADAVPYKARVSELIIYLNDRAGWTREQIADWLETLDVDLSFNVSTDPEEPENNTEGE